MTYRQAKKLRVGDKVNAKKFLLNEFITPIQITEIHTEEKDIFVQDENGRLYHHTALRPIKYSRIV